MTQRQGKSGIGRKTANTAATWPNSLPYGNGSVSEHGYYTLSTATSADGSTFTLTATRAGPQIADSKCGNFTLDEKGVKDIASGTPGTAALCWR